jgi:hypothetical protein
MPLSAPGPPSSAPLPRGCHAPRRSSALNALSGPRAGVPTAPFRPHRRRCPNRLALPRPNHTAAMSESCAVRPSDAVASFIHGDRRPSSPLAVLHSWSVELTFPSLLPVAGPPPATVDPPRRKSAAAEPVFSPSPSTRSSDELSSPPSCPAGSLTVVGARPPLFAPPPPLWRHRRPRRDAHPGAVTAPACTALCRAVVGRTGRDRPGKRRPRAAHMGRASAVNVGHTRCAHGLSRRRECGPRVHCASGPSMVLAQWQPI